jgi:hypothetical protein
MITSDNNIIYAIKINDKTGNRLRLTDAEIRRIAKRSKFSIGYDWIVDENKQYTFTQKQSKV